MKNYLTVLLVVFPMLYIYSQNARVTSYQVNSAARRGNNGTYFGLDAGSKSYGYNNVFTGTYAGKNTLNGSGNVFTGYSAGLANTSGRGNVFTGIEAGVANTTGKYNVFTGSFSARRNTTGSYNVFSGYQSGYNNASAKQNIFIGGYRAGYNNRTGTHNIFMGRQTGLNNTSGENNIFVGTKAGYSNNASSNLYIGNNAGFNTTVGGKNTFIGERAGYSNVFGTYNVSLGYSSGQLIKGSYNTVIGSFAGTNNTGTKNVFLGYQAGYFEKEDNKLIIANTLSKSLIYGDFATNQLGINTEELPGDLDYALAVGGKMVAEEIKVILRETDGTWPDYVFTDAHKLPTLQDVESHIKEKGHLKNIPSAKDVEENGILIGDMNAKLLEKIEELTLYTIRQEKEIQKLKIQQNDHAEIKADLIRLEQMILNLKNKK